MLECWVLRDVSWFVRALASLAGYLYLCYAFELRRAWEVLESLSLITIILIPVTARIFMLFLFLDVEISDVHGLAAPAPSRGPGQARSKRAGPGRVKVTTRSRMARPKIPKA